MQLEITNLASGVTRVILSGRMDLQGSTQLENPFTFQLTTQKAAIVVDMSQVDFIASIGMRLLLKSAKAQQGRGGKLVLCNPQTLVKEALAVAGIDQIIPIHHDFDRASQDVAGAVAS